MMSSRGGVSDKTWDPKYYHSDLTQIRHSDPATKQSSEMDIPAIRLQHRARIA